MTLEEARAQYDKIYQATIDFATGEWVEVDTGTRFANQDKWLEYTEKKREVAMLRIMELTRDFTSAVQTLPGEKPEFPDNPADAPAF